MPFRQKTVCGRSLHGPCQRGAAALYRAGEANCCETRHASSGKRLPPATLSRVQRRSAYIYVSAPCGSLHTLRTASRRWHPPCLISTCRQSDGVMFSSREETRFTASVIGRRAVRDDCLRDDAVDRRCTSGRRGIRARALACQPREAVRDRISSRGASTCPPSSFSMRTCHRPLQLRW